MSAGFFSRFHWLRSLAAPFLLLAVVLAAYYPSLSGKPIWDDSYLVVGHPLTKSPVFVVEVFRQWTFLESISTYYRPVQLLSYLGDYIFWRGDIVGYHLTNIAIHGVAAILLLSLLTQLLPRLIPTLAPKTCRLLAFAISLIWAVHPIHNAAVAYMSGRADPLAMVFALSAWLLYLRGAQSSRPLRARLAIYGGACLLTLLALCSKEIAFTWMVLFLLVHAVFLPTAQRRWILVAALLAVTGAYLCLRSLPPPREAKEGRMPGSPPLQRIHLVIRALGDYTHLIFWPDSLRMCRSVTPELAYPQLKEWYPKEAPKELTWIGLGTVAAFIGGCKWKGRGQRLRRLGVAWFCIGFLPISNLFPLNAQVAEHWIYMPSIGYLLFLLGAALELPSRWHRWGWPFLVVATAGLMMRTAQRASDWTSPLHFFSRTFEEGAYDPRAFFHYARAHFLAGQPKKAEYLYQQFEASLPNYPTFLLGLSEIYAQQGLKDKAEQMLRRVNSGVTANQTTALLGLTQLEIERGNLDAAVALLKSNLEGPSPAYRLLSPLSRLLATQGRKEEALEKLHLQLEVRPWDIQAYLDLADFYQKNGSPQEAIPLLAKAMKMDIWATQAHQQRAILELERNDPNAALEWVRQGLARKPGEDLYLLEAKVLLLLDRNTEAKEAWERSRVWKRLNEQAP